MKSRYLTRLDSDIDLTLDPIARDLLRAERAGYLARLGRIQEAREEIQQVRDAKTDIASVRVSVLVNIADGLCHYFEDMGPESRDRFLRAYSLAAAVGQDDLQSRAGSLLALSAYGAYDFVGMINYIKGAITRKNILDKSTKSRLCMLLALTAHLANRFDIAFPWYQKSRRYAAEVEDEATISAVMHNMASIWAANRRNQVLGGIKTNDKLQNALVGASSTVNFDQLVGAFGLSSLTPLIQAQLFSLDGKYDSALEVYSSILDELKLRSVEGWQSWLCADRGWCYLQLGKIHEGRQELTRAQQSLCDDQHIDDQAATFKRLSDSYSMLGDTETASAFGVRAVSCWRQFRDLQSEMLERVTIFADSDI